MPSEALVEQKERGGDGNEDERLTRLSRLQFVVGGGWREVDNT
jgi:hypothetical protein